MIRRYVITILVILALLCVPGCKISSDNNVIRIDGSTTMYDLSRVWADAYMRNNPGFTVKVSRSGTTQGISAFIDGKIDIAESSRKLTAEEVLRAQKNGVRVEEYYVGFAVYAIVVNPVNSVKELSEDQVRDIFLGKITSWKEVGGKDEPIDVYYREIPPHEYDYFLEEFVNIGQNLSQPPSVKILPSPQMIVKEVVSNERAISYLFLQDLGASVKTLGIARRGNDQSFVPTIDQGSTGEYPLLRPYFMYISKNYRKPVKQYIHFLYTKEGLEIARKMNFVPVPVKEGEVDRDVLFEFL